MKIRNKKTGEIKEISEKDLKKYGLGGKTKGRIKKMDGESGANLVLGDSMNMFGADGLNNFDFSQGTNPNPAYTDASNFNLNQQGNQDNFNYEDWLNQGMGSPQIPNLISTSPYVNRIMAGVKGIADGTNSGNDAQAAAGGLKVFIGAGALGADTGGKMSEGYNTQKQENNLMYNQLDGAMANSYTFRNKNKGVQMADGGRTPIKGTKEQFDMKNKLKKYPTGGKTSPSYNFDLSLYDGKPTQEDSLSYKANFDMAYDNFNSKRQAPIDSSGFSNMKYPPSLSMLNSPDPQNVYNQNKMLSIYGDNQLKQAISPYKDALNQYNANNPKTTLPYFPEFADGGSINDYKSMNMGGAASVEVEDKETIQTPEGLIGAVYGDTHAQGGIPMNLPQGSKVLSEKLKNPKTKQSYAKMGKKLETKKDLKHLEEKTSDKINKETANLNITLKNQALDELFNDQEMNKLNGTFGNKVRKNAMKDYEMKYGGKIKKAEDGVFTGLNPKVDPKTLRLLESEKQRRNKFLPYSQGEFPTGYGSQLGLESVFSDFETNYGVKLPNATNEQKLQALREYQSKLTPELTKDYKLNFARGNKELFDQYKKSKGYKAQKDEIKESNNFYDWAKNSGKITEDYANKGLWGHEYYNTGKLDFNTEEEYNKWLQDPDWNKVGNYYVDRSADPSQPITYYNLNKKYQTLPTKGQQQSDEAIKVKEDTEGLTKEEAKKYGNKPVFGIPRSYARDPEMLFQLTPEEYVPQRINPQLIRRPYRGNTSVDRSIAGQDYANDYMTNLNAINQAEIANTQTKNQASQFNIQNRQNINAQNLGYKDRFATNILQGKANVTQQQMLDQNALINAFTEMDYEGRRGDMLKNIYDPNALASQLGWVTQQMDKEKATKKKFGGKVKIKAKKKK